MPVRAWRELRVIIARGGICIALPMLVMQLSACSTRTVLKATAQPETSYKLITPPDAPHYALRQGQSAQLPKPVIGHFAPPVYPGSLAKAGMPLVKLKAQLVFGADGKVQDVYFLPGSYAGVGRALFEEAVRAAARDWAFTPLVFEAYSNPAMDAGTLQREARPFSLWFEFSFEMVRGKPVVETVKR